MKNAWQIFGDIVNQAIYWHVPGAKQLTDRYLNRPAGFNKTVDDRRYVTIIMKLTRGQTFITSDDARFLIKYLKEDNNA